MSREKKSKITLKYIYNLFTFRQIVKMIAVMILWNRELMKGLPLSYL